MNNIDIKICEQDNGWIVYLEKWTLSGQYDKNYVAKTKEEVVKIISDFLQEKFCKKTILEELVDVVKRIGEVFNESK